MLSQYQSNGYFDFNTNLQGWQIYIAKYGVTAQTAHLVPNEETEYYFKSYKIYI